MKERDEPKKSKSEEKKSLTKRMREKKSEVEEVGTSNLAINQLKLTLESKRKSWSIRWR